MSFTSAEYKFAEIGSHQIAYRRSGQGTPTLLIHGVACYSFIWKPIVKGLEDLVDLITPDLLGCGASDKPEDADYSITAQSDYLIGLMDSLKIEHFHLVGHDVGGGVAQIMAVNHADRIIDLTLINPVGYNYWPVQPITAMRAPVIRHLAQSVMNYHSMRLIVRRGFYNKERLTEELMREFWLPFESKSGRRGFFNLIKAINNQLLTDITDQLRTLQLSTLLIRGGADAYLGKVILDQLSADIPNSRLEVIPNGGHFLQLDEPEPVIKILRDHFEQKKVSSEQ